MTDFRKHSQLGWLTDLRAIVRPDFVVLLILVVFEVYLVTSSEGFHRVDEGAHFIDNVNVIKDPSVSIGIWHRFGRVWLYAVPAQLGHKAVKVLASLLFLVTIFICYKVCEVENIPGKEWIVALVGFQPIFLDVSYTCFAELPAALLLVLSYYLYRISWWRLSLCTASLVFLFRFEMSVLALLIFLIAIRQRRYSALPYVLVGPLVWYLFASVWTGDLTLLPGEFLKFSKYPKYAEGAPWDHYLTHSADIFGVAQLALFVVFLLFDIFDKRIRFPIVTATAVFCFVINTFAASKSFNWTGSVGDLRYLTPVSPFVGILALKGMSQFIGSLHEAEFTKYVPHCLAVVMVVTAVTEVKPHHLTVYEKAVMQLSREAAQDSTPTPILSNHWASTYALLDDKDRVKRIAPLSADTLRTYSRAYIIWDPLIANSAFSQQALTFDNVRQNPEIRPVDSIAVYQQTLYLFLKNTQTVPTRERN
jgi:hypothetical protein